MRRAALRRVTNDISRNPRARHSKYIRPAEKRRRLSPNRSRPLGNVCDEIGFRILQSFREPGVGYGVPVRDICGY